MSSEPHDDAAGAEPPAEPPTAVVAPRRLHPAGIAVLGVGSLRELALPLGIAFVAAVFGGGGQPITRAVFYAVIGALIATIAGGVRWATTRWSVGDGRIRLRTGLLSEKETDVPLGRVQAIDTVHGPLQRLFGVRGVQVQTAGGAREAEIKLPAVSPADVELLRAAVRGRAAPEPATEPAPLAERRLDRARLVVAALTAGQVGVLLPFLAAVPQLGDELWGNDIENAGREGLQLVPHTAPEWLLAGVVVILVAWALSSAGAVLAFAGFTVARDDDRLRIRRGLVAQREATVPVARVQAVRVVEGLLREPFGLVTVRAEVAGYAREAAAAQTLFPLLRRAEVEPFLAALLPELADGVDGLHSPPRRALRRYVLWPAALLLAPAAAACVLAPGTAPWPLLAVLPAAAYGAACWHAAGWRLEGGRLAVRFRRIARTTVLAPSARLQQHGTRQTVLQRRGRLADIEMRVGAATRAEVRHLDADVAGRLFDGLRRADLAPDRLV